MLQSVEKHRRIPLKLYVRKRAGRQTGTPALTKQTGGGAARRTSFGLGTWLCGGGIFTLLYYPTQLFTEL